MDISKALNKLEAVRPDSTDLADPEFADAIAAVEANADSESAFHQQLHADRKIGACMQDVPIPAGLKERLLSAVQNQAQDAFEAADSDTRHATAIGGSPNDFTNAKSTNAKSNRWNWFRIAAALTVAAAVVIGFVISRPGQLTLADIESELPLRPSNLNSLQNFDGFSLAQSPTAHSIQSSGITPKKWRQAALFGFSDKNTDGSKELCAMLIVQAKHCDKELTSGETFVSQGYVITTWKERNLVCILVVKDTLDVKRIREQFEPATA